MTRRLLGLALLGAALLFTTTSAYGFGGKRKSACGTPCETAYYGSPCGTPCATTVSYVDQKVMVTEWKAVKEDYKYVVNEPEVKKEKVKVKEQAWKDEPYKYLVTEWELKKEKVKVGEWKDVTKEVEVVWYECVPTVTKQKRMVCEWVCVPVTVTCVVPPPSCDSGRRGLFGGLCKKKHNDCAAPCEAPCPQYVTTTVMKRQPVSREIEVDVVTYNRIEHKEKKPVTTKELAWIEKEVEVKKPVQVEKTGMHKVPTWVEVEKEVERTTWKQVEKTGVRDVMKPVQVEKIVKVPVYTTAAPVAAPCATPCASPCATEYSSGHHRAGLFGGRGHGCGCCGR